MIKRQRFSEKLFRIQSRLDSVVSVGLDPDIERMPEHLLHDRSATEAVVLFCREIIAATSDQACAYKLNLAFFEILGKDGWIALEQTIAAIPSDTIIIADAKRGDIGNSARFYAASLFENLHVDACTVSPYMGRDSVEPFLQNEGTAAFVLARTSNPGSKDFQEMISGGQKLYLRVAKSVAKWAEQMPGEAGLVVGATDIAVLQSIRESCPSVPFLIPGVGVQGGNTHDVMTAAQKGSGHIIVNSSRQILYASNGQDFAAAAAREAEKLRQELNNARADR